MRQLVKIISWELLLYVSENCFILCQQTLIGPDNWREVDMRRYEIGLMITVLINALNGGLLV